jgi:DNA-binding transcriptional MerR regulator
VAGVDEGCSIERAAQITGVSRHALRYYERIGVLAPVPRDTAGRRRYTEADLGAIGTVTLLRGTGMPIHDVLRFMELTRSGDRTVPDRVALLRVHRDAVRARLDLQERYLDAIETKVSIYEAMLPALSGAPDDPAQLPVPGPGPALISEHRGDTP